MPTTATGYDDMDKATRRQIKKFEKGAEKAARLKEAAARLLKKADDIQATQKPVFDAIILKMAYAAGLDRLPLGAIVSGFATLHSSSTTEFTTISDADPVSAVETVDRDGDAEVQASEVNIDLIVKISRNTAPKRFALLDKYLVWNGKEGRWMGKISLLVLKQFEALFEPHRLIYSASASETAEEGASNTTTLADEAMADDSKGAIEPPTTDGETGAGEGGDPFASDGIISVKVASAEPSTTISSRADEDAPSDAAAGGTEPARSSEALATTAVPRSPFASLRRRGGAGQ
jgi:hypothetical protein